MAGVFCPAYNDENMDSLKVAVISKTDAGGGGASRVAADLSRLLNQSEDIIADHWVSYAKNDRMPYMKDLHGGKLLQTVQKGFRLLSRVVGYPDYLTPELFIHLLFKDKDYDIYHLHDISTALSPLAVSWLSGQKPLVWTFHDCSPFTGGCIFPMDCQNYLTGCQDCPQLDVWPMFTRLDFTGRIQKHKHNLVRRNSIRVIAPSAWMAQETVKSGMLSSLPDVINYGVDTDRFVNHDKRKIRRELGLPDHRDIILLSAWSLHDHRKGLAYAVETISMLKSDPLVLMVGDADTETRNVFDRFETCITGRLNDDRKLSGYYAAADVFLFPTLGDNFPNVVLETMACGTPCVAFNVGGVGEMIKDNITGYLVDKYDIDGLYTRVSQLLKDENLREGMAQNCRKMVIDKFSHSVFVDSHINLYHQVLQQHRNAGQ